MAFGTMSADLFESAANRSPEPAVLFYVTDDDRAGEEVERLIRTGRLRAGEGRRARTVGPTRGGRRPSRSRRRPRAGAVIYRWGLIASARPWPGAPLRPGLMPLPSYADMIVLKRRSGPALCPGDPGTRTPTVAAPGPARLCEQPGHERGSVPAADAARLAEVTSAADRRAVPGQQCQGSRAIRGIRACRWAREWRATPDGGLRHDRARE